MLGINRDICVVVNYTKEYNSESYCGCAKLYMVAEFDWYTLDIYIDYISNK